MVPYRLFAATAMLLAVTTWRLTSADRVEVNKHVESHRSMARVRANPRDGEFCDKNKRNPCDSWERYSKPVCKEFGQGEYRKSLCAYEGQGSYVRKVDTVLCAQNLGTWWERFNKWIEKFIPQDLAEILDTKQTMWIMAVEWMTLFEEAKSRDSRTITCSETKLRPLNRGSEYYKGKFNTFEIEMGNLKDKAKASITKALNDAHKGSCQTDWTMNTYSGGIPICCIKDGIRQEGKWEPLCCKWQNQEIAPSDAANIKKPVNSSIVQEYLMSHVLVHAIYKRKIITCGQED